jgi:hypothetical protein
LNINRFARQLGEALPVGFVEDIEIEDAGLFGESEPANTPRSAYLLGLKRLVQQLLLFRSGTRAQTRNAEIMARFAKELTETEIEALSAYFASSL